MTKKIGRNDPCPCGSGKKFKHCCLKAGELNDSSAGVSRNPLQSSGLNAPKIIAYLNSHDVAPIIDYLIAIQLNPDNYGKNLRIEHLCQLAVSSLGKSTQSPDLRIFKKLIDEEYPSDMMEDIPLNMYCETVLFHGGNFTFFPGLSTYCSELFRAMTESIYRVGEDTLPDAFKDEIHQGIFLLLELGDVTAARAKIARSTAVVDKHRELLSEPISSLSYVMPDWMIASSLRRNNIDQSVLNSFLLDKDNDDILASNPEQNPALYKPILKYKGNYYFIGILNQGCAINNFILKTAIKHNCLPELVRLTHETIWNRIGLSCIEHMRWVSFDFDRFLNNDEHSNECLFQIDNNWLALVCYAKDTADDVSIDGAEKSAYWKMNDQLKQSLANIRQNEKTRSFHVLTLFFYASMGELFTPLLEEQTDTDYLLYFSAFDFLQLVQTEKWDSMSLVRYARTKARMTSLNNGINQPLDCYNMYKQKGENFYLNDDPKPYFLQLVPNEGCALIRDSKLKLDYHGTPMHNERNRICYIPVQRDMDYADIYDSLDKSINAKCCESYSIPIWVRCTQTEEDGENPSSIADTTITAIAFWMDRLRPALYGYIEDKFNDSIEIDLVFDEKTISDKYIHHDLTKPVGEGFMTVSRTDSGVIVTFDNNYIIGFMGADNCQERRMMKGIVSALINEPVETVQSILDQYMPLGFAKMVLMTEATNSPLSIPLWLNYPIYIHPASNQLMLDLFPKWMEEKGCDITGGLSGNEQKEEFLHNGVDVLLSKLDETIVRFDSTLLLKRLISNHETLIYQREYNKVLHPAQIICFGDNEEKRKDLLETEQRLSEAGLATRALIEYVAAKQWNVGHEIAGSDDIELLLAIMSKITHIGGICDAVHLGVSNHTIEKLESGRYGIYDDGFNDSVLGFASARSIESVNDHVDDFERKMEYLANLEPKVGGKKDAAMCEIDEAFTADWGVSYSTILKVLYGCYLNALDLKQSVVEYEEKQFVSSIVKFYPELTEEEIGNALEHLSFEQRSNYLTPPEGMDAKEIFPWIYNREISYLRRPIVKMKEDEDKTNLVFGFRSCLLAGLQLSDLLYSGRLKHVGRKLDKLLGKYQAEKGKVFNDKVRDWLTRNTALEVCPYDVTMKPNGNLDTKEDLGDIDVLAYDKVGNVLFSIECKNTNTAKNVREMKKEMDDYLGRDDNPAKDKKKSLVMKHLRRHQWMKDNMEKVMTFVGVESAPIIKSMMMTSEVIPTSYLRKEDTPLSILNFQELKRNGVDYLNGAKYV